MRKRMLMVAASCVVAMLMWPVVLGAQNEPFLGIWELNLAKSSITRGAPPVSETIVNTSEPGGFRSLLAVVNATTTSVEVQHFVFDGAFHRTDGSDPRELSFRRVDANTIEQDTRRGTEVTVHRRIEVSNDLRTMTYVANGKSGSGQAYTNDTRVYDRR